GRFLSEDPIGIAGGLNLYAYSGNDPVNNRDPFGLDPECPKDGSPARLDNGTFCLASVGVRAHRQYDRLSGRPFIMGGIPGGAFGAGSFSGKGGGAAIRGGGKDGSLPEDASLKTCNSVLIAVTCFVLGPGKGWVDQLQGLHRPPFTEIVEPYPLNAEKRAFEEMLKNRRLGVLSRFLLRMPLLILMVPPEAICSATIRLNAQCVQGTPDII
ncbi:MAG: RHS repeat-associated core domain-containing protein, partial [Candidatus Binatia bacterium]